MAIGVTGMPQASAFDARSLDRGGDRMRTIRSLLTDPRGSGRTTATCVGARHVNGIVLCHNQDFANHVAHIHAVHTMSMNTTGKLVGDRRPIFFDHHAMAQIISGLEKKLSDATKEVARLKARLKVREIAPGDAERYR